MQWFGDGSQAGASDQSDSEPEVAEAEPAEDVCQDCLGGDILDDEMFAPLGEEPAQSGEAQSSAVAGVPPAGSSALEPDAPGEAMHVAGESSGSQVAPSVAENPVGGASSRASAGPRGRRQSEFVHEDLHRGCGVQQRFPRQVRPHTKDERRQARPELGTRAADWLGHELAREGRRLHLQARALGRRRRLADLGGETPGQRISEEPRRRVACSASAARQRAPPPRRRRLGARDVPLGARKNNRVMFPCACHTHTTDVGAHPFFLPRTHTSQTPTPTKPHRARDPPDACAAAPAQVLDGLRRKFGRSRRKFATKANDMTVQRLFRESRCGHGWGLEPPPGGHFRQPAPPKSSHGHLSI